MTIWLLAILVLASVAALGYQQGAIRASISFFGIILAALLAPLAGKIFKPLLGLVGVVNPVWLWVLPPLFGFVLVLALVKVGAFMVHQKVDVYYKYKAGDLRLALWERLNDRLGACVGLLNGVAYLVLIAFVIHAFSYWTVQMASADTDPKTVRLLNALGRDLQSTGMNRVAKAIDPLPAGFYDTADLAGKLLYQNSLLEARLLRYPGLLTLGEKPEFQTLGQDTAFAEMRLKGASINEVLEQPSAKAVFANPELLKEIWTTIQPNLSDLRLLETGKSAKYDGEKIARALAVRFQRFDARLSAIETRVAGTEAEPHARLAARAFRQSRQSSPRQTRWSPSRMYPNSSSNRARPPRPIRGRMKGTWKSDGSDYEFNLEGGTEKRTAKFEGRLLVIAQATASPSPSPRKTEANILHQKTRTARLEAAPFRF
jgi:uncharacterized membrane protein required for colicin V production